ncbi:RNA methyltransferase, TrmH family, group 3 [Thioalkalivibrio sp. K90mix]|uniref:23S rRNA (guanosine(2251)-2'-O)-methyltransferase RlmB n=1 Tax=Thioalkalivibrio sp. (strain K90mix) TaxID=396595 RepID=UPI0001959F9C|nr:23S rRNA (guanosine(2251)-2'-O)-methyltransferase RlmB [Thioalkalivibrio sp. K90mix]ADC72428.1 RNA methyltransferase, TrmH family, group 3 [Thioalkalivibrio sp. K90mix]
MGKGGKGPRGESFGGIHAVAAVLQHAPERVRLLQLASGTLEPALAQLLEQAQARGISVERAGRDKLDQHHPGFQHQGVIVHCAPRPVVEEKALVQRVRNGLDLVLVLDGVTDPHNLGACLRTADAAGAGAIVTPRHHSAALTPAAIKVASGAAETVPVVAVGNLARTLAALKDAGMWTVGLDGAAHEDLYAVDLRPPTAIVMGAEGEGMRRLTREACDHLARIPMGGTVESLNVSVATGITLFEARRQRRA